MKTRRNTIRLLLFALLFLSSLLFIGCRQNSYTIDKPAHDKEMADWKKTRLDRLTRCQGHSDRHECERDRGEDPS